MSALSWGLPVKIGRTCSSHHHPTYDSLLVCFDGEILDRRLMSVLGLFAWVSDVLLSLVAAKLSSSNARKRFIKTKSPNITCLWFVSFWLLECWGWGETFLLRCTYQYGKVDGGKHAVASDSIVQNSAPVIARDDLEYRRYCPWQRIEVAARNLTVHKNIRSVSFTSMRKIMLSRTVPLQNPSTVGGVGYPWSSKRIVLPKNFRIR